MDAGSVGAFAQHHQEMIAHGTQQGPGAGALIELPQLAVQSAVALANPREIRRRREQAQPPIALQRESGSEGAIELSRSVVAGPDGALVHPDRNGSSRVSDPDARPAAQASVVRHLPGADPPDDAED